MKNSQKGFTLIELLVVIAIIGILATIVLTSLGSATKKAKDSKIQGQVSSMRAQAQLWTSTTVAAVTSGACASVTNTLVDSANATSLYSLVGNLTLADTYCTGEAVLPSNGGRWAVAAKLSDNKWACADYTGQSIISSQATGAAATGTGTWTCTP